MAAGLTRARLPLGCRWLIGVALTGLRIADSGFLACDIAASCPWCPSGSEAIHPRADCTAAADWLGHPERCSGQREDLTPCGSTRARGGPGRRWCREPAAFGLVLFPVSTLFRWPALNLQRPGLAHPADPSQFEGPAAGRHPTGLHRHYWNNKQRSVPVVSHCGA